MSARLLIRLLLACWAVLIVCSVLVPMNTAPTDFGFTRGLNRLTLFFQFQLAAVVVALILLALSQKLPAGAGRWLARLPALFALVLGLTVAGFLIWAAMIPSDGPGYTPPGPVTAPANTQEG